MWIVIHALYTQKLLSVVKAGYRFSGAAAPCSGVQGTYKLHAAAFAQCILLPTLQNMGTKLLVTLPVEKLASKFMFLVLFNS